MDDVDTFDREDDSDPGEGEADDLAFAFDGEDSVPPSSFSMAMAFGASPARPCTSFADLPVAYADLGRKKLLRRGIAPPPPTRSTRMSS